MSFDPAEYRKQKAERLARGEQKEPAPAVVQPEVVVDNPQVPDVPQPMPNVPWPAEGQ